VADCRRRTVHAWVARDEVLAAASALQQRSGGAPFRPEEVVRELARAGSGYAEQTVRTHVVHHLSAGPKAPLERVDRGLYILRALAVGVASDAESTVAMATTATAAAAWPWEGAVQAVFASVLTAHGWSLRSVADTASKQRGVDVLADKAQRRLGAEVKGWPSRGYADPRRAEEAKRTQPTTQASHWFAQALMKAVMLRDSHDDHESLVVLPDHRRYRDLAAKTRTGRAGAAVHVVLLEDDGAFSSETWTP
jgi:hypothetical protein